MTESKIKGQANDRHKTPRHVIFVPDPDNHAPYWKRVAAANKCGLGELTRLALEEYCSERGKGGIAAALARVGPRK